MSFVRSLLPFLWGSGAPGFARTLAALCFTASPLTAAQPGGFTVNPASREAARVFYRTVYVASENVDAGWTGDVAAGNAGTTSAGFKVAVQRRVNWFRAMAGVPAGVTLDPTWSAKDQQAALMMSANGMLSHTPNPNWAYYTAAGAEAAGKSNLALGEYGPDAITGYIGDSGSTNVNAGHRRWILYPQTRTMGTGDIPGDEDFFAANALWVQTADFGTARPPVRDSFVAWPPPGFVPHALVFPRWSFSYPGASFANATVKMQRGAAGVPVSIQGRASGYGENSIVWAWDNLDPNAQPTTLPPPVADTPVQVTINGVTINGTAANFAYTVTIFDPRKAGADTVLASVAGPSQLATGTSGSYICAAGPLANGGQFRTAKLSAFTAIEGAENGTGNVTVQAPAGASVISSKYHAGGAKAFHLTTPGFASQSITLKRTVLPSATSLLKFKSRFGYASSRQVARVEVSTDEGATWDRLFTAAGTGTPAAAFSAHTLSLAPYAGRTLQVRFVFSFESPGIAFTQAGEDFGWSFDDVAFTEARELTAIETRAASASTSLAFAPAAAGTYAVQARGRVFGDYLFEWGSVLAVTATAGPTTPPPVPSVLNATGTFRGLALTVPTAHASCGLVTLTVAPTGIFSGKAVIGGATLPFKGVFDAAGLAHFGRKTEATLARPGLAPLLLRLRLPTDTTTPMRVLGDVREAGGFTANIDAPRAVFSTAVSPIAPLRNPPAQWPGLYTATLGLDPGTPIPALAGAGWARLSVTAGGSARFTGTLADGTRWRSTQPLAVDGTAPVFFSLYGGKGSMFGIVRLTGSPVTLVSTVQWFRPSNLPGTRFAAGWPGGMKLILEGGTYTPFVPAQTWPLPGLAATSGSARLVAHSGGVPPNLTWQASFSLATGAVIVSPTTSGVTADIVCTAATGAFTGTIKPPGAPPLTISGVLLPGLNRARGFILTPTGSGIVGLLPQ